MRRLCGVRSWRRSAFVTAARVLSAVVLAGGSTQAIAEVAWQNPGAQALPQMSPIGAAQAIRALASPGRTQHVLVSFYEPIRPDDPVTRTLNCGRRFFSPPRPPAVRNRARTGNDTWDKNRCARPRRSCRR